MSHYETELPEVIIKPAQMISTSKLKAIVVVLALVLYVYLLMFFKTFYLTSQKLDHILEMALSTEKRILNVHNADQNLVMKLAQIDKLYEDY